MTVANLKLILRIYMKFQISARERVQLQWASLSGYLAISPNIAKIRQFDCPIMADLLLLRRYCNKNISL